MNPKPKIRVFYIPPRITIDKIEIPGGYEAIVVNVQEVECAASENIIRHETAEEAKQDLLKANGWDEHKCKIEIIAL